VSQMVASKWKSLLLKGRSIPFFKKKWARGAEIPVKKISGTKSCAEVWVGFASQGEVRHRRDGKKVL